MIRERTTGYSVKDEISEALGDQRYALNWYPPGLKERTVGPHSLDIVSVSRYYFLLTPRVVIDFEPSPLDSKFWIDEKRAWCYQQGIVYVAVMLTERLTAEQFKARVKEERDYLLSGARAIKDQLTLDSVVIDSVLKTMPPDRTVEDVLRHPASVKYIDEETMRRFEVDHGHKAALRGIARTAVIERIKRTVIEEVRDKVKHGRMGRVLRDQQPAVAARG